MIARSAIWSLDDLSIGPLREQEVSEEKASRTTVSLEHYYSLSTTLSQSHYSLIWRRGGEYNGTAGYPQPRDLTYSLIILLAVTAGHPSPTVTWPQLVSQASVYVCVRGACVKEWVGE